MINGGARALWKIINSGYGICNGIAQIEKYIFNKIGISSDIISSGQHTFLKLNNIEVPVENGEIITGDTILDPTWNLAAHRYGDMPRNFCRSYEEIRKHDIDNDGKDHKCHENDEELSNVTLNLEEKRLRQIFTSVGIANENGEFPIKDLEEKSRILDELKLPEEESIKKQFTLLSEYYPDFAMCHNSTEDVLQGVLLNNKNLQFNRCVVNRVYEREDKERRPVLYVYVDFPKSGKKFYFVNKETMQFVELPQKEFESKFECYDLDLEQDNGVRPWEMLEKEEKMKDLSRSSGKIVYEGEEI